MSGDEMLFYSSIFVDARVKPLARDLVYSVCRRINPTDKQEILASSDLTDDELFPTLLCNHVMTGQFGFVCLDKDNQPQSVVSLHRTHSKCYSIGMFSSDMLSKCFTTLHKACKIMKANILSHNIMTRVEARSIISHTRAHKWIESLGASNLCVLKCYGKNNEDFVLFNWHIKQ